MKLLVCVTQTPETKPWGQGTSDTAGEQNAKEEELRISFSNKLIFCREVRSCRFEKKSQNQPNHWPLFVCLSEEALFLLQSATFCGGLVRWHYHRHTLSVSETGWHSCKLSALFLPLTSFCRLFARS